MSTRGFIGLVVDGTEKITYNHSDSYPDWLGVRFLTEVQQLLTQPGPAILEQARNLRVVDEDSKPPLADVEALKAYTDLGVGKQSTDDWYCLLREVQGSLLTNLKVGYMLDASGFPLTSLFCEWGYLLDLDAQTLEVYKGFQNAPPTEGRWVGRVDPQKPWTLSSPGEKRYFPVQRIERWPLSEVPSLTPAHIEVLAYDPEIA